MAIRKRATKTPVVDIFNSGKMSKSELVNHLTELGMSATPSQRRTAITQICTDLEIPTDTLDQKSDAEIQTLGNVCILLSKGHDLSDLYEQATIKNKLESLLISRNETSLPDPVPKVVKTRTISTKLSTWLNNIDTVLDEFIRVKDQVSLTLPTIQDIDKFDLTYLKTQELPLWQKELERMSTEELAEGYSNFSQRRLKALKKFYESLIQLVAIEPILKPRKSRVSKKSTKLKPIEKQLANLLCNEEKSKVKKKDILTASELWAYNERYHSLIHLVAEEGKKFEIKGTTLQNVDMEKSRKKRVRQKTETTIQVEISKANKSRCLVVFNSIHSKEYTPTPRLTTDTILLQVF